MRITKNQLKQIIKEELASVISERSTTVDDVKANVVRAGAGRFATGEFGQDLNVSPAGGSTTGQLPWYVGAASSGLGSRQSVMPVAQNQSHSRTQQIHPHLQNLIRGKETEVKATPTVFGGNQGDPYEYKEVDGQYQARKKGSDEWRSIKKGSKAHKSIASVQGGGKSLYKKAPKKRNIGPEFVADQKAALKRGIAYEKGATGTETPIADKAMSLGLDEPMTGKEKKAGERYAMAKQAERGGASPEEVTSIKRRGKKFNVLKPKTWVDE